MTRTWLSNKAHASSARAWPIPGAELVRRLTASGLRGVAFRYSDERGESELEVTFRTSADEAESLAGQILEAARVVWEQFPVPLSSLVLKPRAMNVRIAFVIFRDRDLRTRFGPPGCAGPLPAAPQGA